MFPATSNIRQSDLKCLCYGDILVRRTEAVCSRLNTNILALQGFHFHSSKAVAGQQH
jgi:hypothetical protein